MSALSKNNDGSLQSSDRDLPDRSRKAVIATSIAPFDIEKQKTAISSWLALGFEVVSLNCYEEIARIQQHFPEVTFVWVHRDARQLTGKPLVFFDDILEYFRNSNIAVCGIVNSDIRLEVQNGFIKFLERETKNSMVLGSRIDVETADSHYGRIYVPGFDYFFFDRTIIPFYPEDEFMIGAPWWDFWTPFVPLTRKFTVKQLIPPIGYHTDHPYRWSHKIYKRLSERVGNYIRNRQINFDIDDTFPGIEDEKYTRHYVVQKYVLEHSEFITLNSVVGGATTSQIHLQPSDLYNLSRLPMDFENRLRMKIYLTYLQKSIEVYPSDLNSYLTLSYLYGKHGHKFKAADILTRVGEMFDEVGYSKEAETAFVTAQKYNPLRAASGKVWQVHHQSTQKATGLANKKIVIDGVIFQLDGNRPSYIGKIWTALLQALAMSRFSQNIILLDRDATAPNITGIRVKKIYKYDPSQRDIDSLYLQDIIDEECCDLFISTSYTWPENTQSVISLHDVTPEMNGIELSSAQHRAKTKAIEKAWSYFSSSLSVSNGFRKLFPQYLGKKIYFMDSALFVDCRPDTLEKMTAQLVVYLEEIIDDLKNVPFKPSDPMDTPGRLLYALAKCSGWNNLTAVMYDLEQMYVGATKYNASKMLISESVIADMKSDIFNLIRQSFPHIQEKNGFFYYYLGLALQKRNLLPEALEAYSVANDNWKVRYKWRPAYLAGDVALQIGNLDLAQRLLKEAVLEENPSKRKAMEKLRLIEKKQKQPSAGIKGETVPLSTMTTEEISGSEIIGAIPGQIQNAGIKVSAIVSTYNSEKFIRGCLKDLVNQTLYKRGELEIIVIDSGSQQNEKAVVKDFQRRFPSISYVRTERETVYAAWNRGIKLSRGQYITNANTDDRHRRDALEVMADILDRNPGIGVVYADVIVTDKENETFDRHTPVFTLNYPDYDRQRLALSSYIGPQPMWKKSLHDHYGYFDEAFVVSGDWEFWLRIAEGSTFLHIPECLGLYLRSSGSVEHRQEAQRDKENNLIHKTYIPKYFPNFEATVSNAVKAETFDRNTVRLYGEVLTSLERYGLAIELYSAYLKKNPHDQAIMVALKNLEAKSNERQLQPGPAIYEMPPQRDDKAEVGVSVIIPCYKQAQYLPDAVKSVIGQTYANWECIIINDGSPDDTSEVARQLIERNPGKRIILLEKENGGLAEARNFGIKNSRGKYILPLDSDDQIYPEMLQKTVSVLEINPEIAFVFTFTAQFDEKTGEYKTIGFREFDPQNIRAHNSFSYCSLYRREVWEAVGGYNTNMVWGYEDWDFWVGCVDKGFRGKLLPEPLFMYRVKESSMVTKAVEHDAELKAQIILNHPVLYNRAQIAWAKGIIARDDRVLGILHNEGIVPGFFDPLPFWLEASLSMIIVTFNSSQTIRECIDSVLRHTAGGEVIVVDNASIDETRSILGAYEADKLVTLILNGDNKGFSYACNQGIRASAGEYVILLNPDTIVTPYWAERMLSHFKEGVGAVGPVSNYVAALQKLEYYSSEPFRGKHSIDEFSEKLYRLNRGQGKLTKLLMGFCMAFPRKLLDEVGPLDENLFLGNDDLEISWRLRMRGYKLVIATDTFVYHEGQVSFKSQEERPSTHESTQKLYAKLEAHYGAGNVPAPIELWGIDFFRPEGARFKSIKPSFAAVYCVYDDVTWLHDSLESIYYAMDAVYFLISDRPWYGQPADNTETLERIKAFPDPHNKISIIRGTWSNETDQRNAGLDIVKDKGIAYCFVIDADEIYDPVELQRMMDLAVSHPEVDCWRISLDTYWKSYHYRIEPREPLKPPVFVKTGDIRFIENRRVSAGTHAEIPPEIGICHHLSYAHNDAEVLKKIKTFSHAHEVLPGWFEKVWQRWDSDHSLKNLHPTHPKCYKRAVEQPYSALPPVLQRHCLSDSKHGEDAMPGLTPTVFQNDLTPGLTSVIILTFNQLRYTKECVESIRKHTPDPHEIIFVDNGSKDGTVKWLRRLVQENPSYKLIENERNLGFAKGCNQGILVFSGEYVLLLNNDVVVTEGWLSGMLECLNSTPDTGVIGPMTNNVAGIQKIDNVGYSSVDHLQDYAQSFREKNRHRRIPAQRLVGFCMIFRRALAEKIGLLDERFGTGGYEDNDYCLRAAIEGYSHFVAGDVFIHHYGSRSFKGSGIHYASQMDKNWQIFSNKWGSVDPNSPTGIKHKTVNTLTAASQFNHQGLPENAVRVLIEGIKVDSDDQRLHYALADIFTENKKFSEALGILEKMPESLRQNARWFENIALCKKGLQLNTEAGSYADKALLLNSASPIALNVKGLIAFEKGLQSEAEDFFRKALEADSGFAPAYLNISGIRWLSDDKASALDLSEKAFILSPVAADIAMGYYSTAVSLSQLERAESLFKEASSLYPSNRRLKSMLIDMLIRMEKYAAAMKMVEETMISFGIDENTLAAALELRSKVGPMEIQNGTDSISLCMIVKDEQFKIGHCLSKIKPAVDELIVVDTGSRDRTKDIAKAFGAKVYDFPWADDFSEARNFALSKAAGKWIMILDADEVISAADYDALKELVKKARAKPRAFSFVTRNYVNSMNVTEWTANDGTYAAEEKGTGWFPGEKVRLFPNADVRFEYPVHERVEPSLVSAGIKIAKCDIPVHHYGKLDEGKIGPKAESYYNLAQRKVAEQERPDEKVLHELAVQAGELGKYEEALEYLKKVLALNPEYAPAYRSMGNNYFNLGRYEEALAAFKTAVRIEPDMRDAVLMRSACEIYTGNAGAAIQYLEDLLRKDAGFIPAMTALAAAYFCLGQKNNGAELVKRLKELKTDLSQYFLNMHKNLIAAGQPAYAASLLESLK